MRKLFAAIWSESLKVLHSKVFGTTFIFFALLPIMTGFMSFIQKNPGLISNVGTVNAGAAVYGATDWTAYLGHLTQQGAAGVGIVGFAFVASWIFGREYTDRTIKDLLALPVSRGQIVLSKFIVLFVWCFLLSLFMFIVGVLMGVAINLNGFSLAILTHAFIKYCVTSILVIVISTPAAFLANCSRGYLVPLAFAISTIILGNFIGTAGLLQYYPWSIPTVYQNAGYLETVSWVILCLTGVLGTFGTFIWWKYADQR